MQTTNALSKDVDAKRRRLDEPASALHNTPRPAPASDGLGDQVGVDVRPSLADPYLPVKLARPSDLWLPGYFNELPDELVERYMDEYKYGLRFRMCMREIKKISEYVTHREKNPRTWVPGTPYNPPGPWQLTMDGAPWEKWIHIQGPGFAIRALYKAKNGSLWRLIGPYGWRSFGEFSKWF